MTFRGEKNEASTVRVSPDREHVAVGYTNGVIRIFNLFTAECSITFSGHRSAITCLKFDSKGMILASGSKVQLSLTTFNFWSKFQLLIKLFSEL